VVLQGLQDNILWSCRVFKDNILWSAGSSKITYCGFAGSSKITYCGLAGSSKIIAGSSTAACVVNGIHNSTANKRNVNIFSSVTPPCYILTCI